MSCVNARCRDGFVQNFAAQPGYEWMPCPSCNPEGAPRMRFTSPPVAEQIARFRSEYRLRGEDDTP